MKRIKKTTATAALISMVAIPAGAETSALAKVNEGHQLSTVQRLDPVPFCKDECIIPPNELAGSGKPLSPGDRQTKEPRTPLRSSFTPSAD